MNLVNFLRENLQEGYDFKLTKELNFNFDKGKDNVVIRIAQGDQYQKGVVQPMTILITTKDVNKSKDIWSDFVKATSDRDYQEGTENYYMMLQTPYVSQLFDEISNNYYHTITVFGTIVITKGIDDIKKITIDDVEIELNEANLQMTGNPSTHQLSTDPRINKSTINSAMLTLNIVTFNSDYGSLTTKLKNMRKKIVSPNQDFSIKIWYSGDQLQPSEKHTMKLVTQNIAKTRGAISLLTLSFAS